MLRPWRVEPWNAERFGLSYARYLRVLVFMHKMGESSPKHKGTDGTRLEATDGCRIGAVFWSRRSFWLTTAGSKTTAQRVLFLGLATIALIYAFLAGLRTVWDPDAFWQLATGRWVTHRHQVFSTDVFSYTAQGQPWIYPVGSSVLLYAVYLIGRYACCRGWELWRAQARWRCCSAAVRR